jgi:hypothetical protein
MRGIEKWTALSVHGPWRDAHLIFAALPSALREKLPVLVTADSYVGIELGAQAGSRFLCLL